MFLSLTLQNENSNILVKVSDITSIVQDTEDTCIVSVAGDTFDVASSVGAMRRLLTSNGLLLNPTTEDQGFKPFTKEDFVG
jgi:hypothetical protein